VRRMRRHAGTSRTYNAAMSSLSVPRDRCRGSGWPTTTGSRRPAGWSGCWLTPTSYTTCSGRTSADRNGSRWAAEFARYGLLMAWIATRSIFGRLRQRSVGLQQPPEAWLDQHAVQELAGDTVVVSLDKFRSTVLIPGKWDHTRGASLRTFFIGQCLLQFANIYRSWFAREQRQRLAVPVEDVALWAADNGADRPVEQQVVLREHVTAELAAVEGSRDRRILGLHSIGYTYRQIGEELGITEKAVESAIGRLRKRRKARQQQDEEETA
jgi:hypothetical protein